MDKYLFCFQFLTVVFHHFVISVLYQFYSHSICDFPSQYFFCVRIFKYAQVKKGTSQPIIKIGNICTDNMTWLYTEVLVYKIIRCCACMIMFSISLIRVFTANGCTDVHFIHQSTNQFSSCIYIKQSPQICLECSFSWNTAQFLHDLAHHFFD